MENLKYSWRIGQPEEEVTEGSPGPAATAAESAMNVTPTPPV